MPSAPVTPSALCSTYPRNGSLGISILAFPAEKKTRMLFVIVNVNALFKFSVVDGYIVTLYADTFGTPI